MADRDLLWDSLMKELNDGGEFETQPASQWSDDSGSGSGSPATLDEDMVGPSRSQATEHLPFSQSQKPSQTFREMGARKRTSPAKKDRTNLRHNLLHSQHARSSQVPQSQRPERQGHANNAVAAVLSQRPRTQASAMVMSSMASSAAKYVGWTVELGLRRVADRLPDSRNSTQSLLRKWPTRTSPVGTACGMWRTSTAASSVR